MGGGGATLLGTVASQGLAGQGLWGKAGPASWENGVLRLASGGGLRQESALQVSPPNPAACAWERVSLSLREQTSGLRKAQHHPRAGSALRQLH